MHTPLWNFVACTFLLTPFLYHSVMVLKVFFFSSSTLDVSVMVYSVVVTVVDTIHTNSPVNPDVVPGRCTVLCEG